MNANFVDAEPTEAFGRTEALFHDHACVSGQADDHLAVAATDPD